MSVRRRKYGRRRSGGRGAEKAGQRGGMQQKIMMITAAGGILLMIFLPEISLLSARKAVNLWLFTIVPSMFPFFICIDLLTKTGMHIRIGKLTEGIFRKFFGVPGVAGFVYLSSVLSGYPTGAKILGELHEEKQISREDVRDILMFCSTSGPLFILGAAGAGMLHSAPAGGIILAAHCAGSLLTGMFLIRRSVFRKGVSALAGIRKLRSRQNAERERGIPAYTDENVLSVQQKYTSIKPDEKKYSAASGGKPAPEMLAESMISSFQTLIVIGGYVVLFMILTDVIKVMLSHFFGRSGFAGELLTGCLEMTSGCSGIAGSDVPLMWKIAACTFVISFGGLSVAAQSVSVLKNSGITLPFFLRFKLIQGLISSVCAITIMKILSGFGGNTAVSVFESAESENTVPVLSLFDGDPGSAYSLFFSSSAVAAAMAVFYLAVALFSGRGCNSDENSGNHSGI